MNGSSNYAFNVILKEANDGQLSRLINIMSENGIEFRRGSAGGGNQLRQPYLENLVHKDAWKDFPVTDHVHFYGFYIGNFPDLETTEIDEITDFLNQV